MTVDVSAPPFNVSPQDFLQDALIYRSWGWSLIPIGGDKKPVGGWKRFQDRRPHDRELCRLFERSSCVGGLAVITGSISGGRDHVLAIRDFDTRNSYKAWAAAFPDLSRVLPTAATPRGAHVYTRLRGSDIFLKLDDGELRASRRHYTAMPPSRHPLGSYCWVRRPLALADLPFLHLEETGFALLLPTRSKETQEYGSHSFSNARESKSRPTSPEQAEESQYGLCANLPSSGLAGLLPEVREAVLRNLPLNAGERNSCLLRLARSLADVVTGVPVAHWAPAVFVWWRLALHAIGTKRWAETWLDFRRAWCRRRIPISMSRPVCAMTEAAIIAGADPHSRIVAACRAKAADSPHGLFYLSGRMAAKVAGLPHRTAARLLTAFVGDGILIVVERGRPSPVRRRATYYRIGTTDRESCRKHRTRDSQNPR